MIDSKKVSEIAKKELSEAKEKKAVKVLKVKYAELEDAKKVIVNIEREIEDLMEMIEDGKLPGDYK